MSPKAINSQVKNCATVECIGIRCNSCSKVCTKCLLRKSFAEFSVRKRYYRSVARISLDSRCTRCVSKAWSERMARSPENMERKRARDAEYSSSSEARVRNAARSTINRHVSYEETVGGASNLGKEWTGPEIEIALRKDLTAVQVAKMLGRTNYAVQNIRHAHKVDPRKQELAGLAPSIDSASYAVGRTRALTDALKSSEESA